VVVADKREAAPQTRVLIERVARGPVLRRHERHLQAVARGDDPILMRVELVCHLHVDLPRFRVAAEMNSIPPLELHDIVDAQC
jgi:hypothetical protein